MAGDSNQVTLAGLEKQFREFANSMQVAIGERSALEQLLSDTHVAGAKQRAALETSLDEQRSVQRAQQALINELQADLAQTAADFGEQLNSALAEGRALEDELKAVKRKYRGAQNQLARERERVRKAQEKLNQAEDALGRIRGTSVFRAYFAIVAMARGLTGSVWRRSGTLSRNQRSRRLNYIRNSPLFDADWYLSRYPDVAASGIDPAVHYLEHGWIEGRDPGPAFSTAAYLEANSDVGRTGINPLLHYVEFGAAEGRGLPGGTRKPAIANVAFDREFDPAAPCVSFPLKSEDPVRWIRAVRLDSDARETVTLGGQVLGTIETESQREALAEACARLAFISGSKEQANFGNANFSDSDDLLRDAWYVADARLRTRWQTSAPLIVRAYQIDDLNGDKLKLVGEGLAVTVLDFIDVNLWNPFFPVLFVKSTPEGTVRGTEVLDFPSLCRGGLHYPELLALAGRDGQRIDVCRESRMLADRLVSLLAGAEPALVAQLQIDPAGADGSESILRHDFKLWLSEVMRVRFVGEGLDGQERDRELIGAGQRDYAGGVSLLLPSDTVPTISALVAKASTSESPVNADLSLIVAGIEPAQPATLVQYPTGAVHNDRHVSQYPNTWPELVTDNGLAANGPAEAVAIRQPKGQTLTDSELLVPMTSAAMSLSPIAKAITWLVFPEEWEDDTLADGLEALSLQENDGKLAVIGDVQRSADKNTAQWFFGQDVRFYADIFDLFEDVGTPLIGYLGAHVLLHDRRTSKILADMLENPDVASASCVMLSTQKRGNSWSVTVADPGTFVTIGGDELPLARRAERSKLLWRTSYPMVRQPRDLWLSRAGAVRGWLERAGPLRADEGIQLCTSLVTASYVREPFQGHSHVRPPASGVDHSIRFEALVG